jgi:hypothetical protein
VGSVWFRCENTGDVMGELLVALEPVPGTADVSPGIYEVEPVVDEQRS